MSPVRHASVAPVALIDLSGKNALQLSTPEPFASSRMGIAMLDGRDAEVLRGPLNAKLIDGSVMRSSEYMARLRLT